MNGMEEQQISRQQSLVTDSFSTIERLESEMASITREFESLDSSEKVETDAQSLPLSHAGDVRSEVTEHPSQKTDNQQDPESE